jgi:hypothetical protein
VNNLDRRILEEYAARKLAQASASAKIQAIKAELFDKQLAFVEDASREKAALCTRRAGKTELVPRYLVIAALESGALCQFWAITRMRAKQLLWKHLSNLNDRHALGMEFNETELSAKLPNGGEIRLLGADKEKETHKKRGDKVYLAIVDESQLFGAAAGGDFLKVLADDVLGPSLGDLRGTLCLMGTPGVICAGHWYDVSREDSELRLPGWNVHRWSAWDNPHMQHLRVDWLEMKDKRRWTDDNPTWLREYMGRWVNDLGALFYKFDPRRNSYQPNPNKLLYGPGWTHVLGWDLGFRDDMALVVWGWHDNDPQLYECFSWKQSGALSAEVVEQIRMCQSRFNIIKMFADTGGGGRMYVEDVQARYGLTFEAAKKTEKYQHVRLLNDDLLSGRIKLQQDSPLMQEMSTLARDLDWPPPDKSELTPPREDPRCPNHCCDAALYAYRGAWHYLHQDLEAKPVPGTEEYWRAEAKRMEQVAVERVMQRKQQHWMERGVVDADWWEET